MVASESPKILGLVAVQLPVATRGRKKQTFVHNSKA